MRKPTPTTPTPMAPAGHPPLPVAAAAAGLRVVSRAYWPEIADSRPAPLAGFIDSSFSPLVAQVAERALHRAGRSPTREAGSVTAIVIVTALGDVTSATRVAATVDAGGRVAPLHFYQSVPNAVAGHLAARWNLRGPVVCVSETSVGLAIAALLIADADADEALVVSAELAEAGDRAAAIVVTAMEGEKMR